jgi:flagellin-like protein
MNMRRNEEAVSPVIATILMVAITVVLAAVLYVMVSGLIGTGSVGSPTVDLTSRPTSDGYELEIASPSRTEGLNAYKVSVLKDGTPWSDGPKAVSGVLEWQNPGAGVEWLNFTDLTSDDKLTGGDFFTLEDLESGSSYEVVLLWASNDNKITSEIINVP